MTIDHPTDTRPPTPGAPTTAQPEAPLLTVDEVAAHYRVVPATVRAWCREHRFRGAERVGKCWRIPQAALTRPPPTPPAQDAAPHGSAPGESIPDGTGLDGEPTRPDRPVPRARKAAKRAGRPRPTRQHANDAPFDRNLLRLARTNAE